ncbi:HTH_Tnp_Tc3_2 domain-containing protein [Trichonephila clavipes]|nr:HTH_Tnp_Tc3_2 domain-containing protein [Trichonephila clavipes]
MGRSDAAIIKCYQEWVDSGRFRHHDALDSSLSAIRRVIRTLESSVTTDRRLIERNLHSYQPLRHLRLTPAHCRARLQWHLSRSVWNHADWGRIAFSNESRFQLCSDDHRRQV